MLFVVNPYATETEYLDPEDAYVEFKRRQYIAALEERQRRVQFERELEREEQRHRLALASIARQEAERRKREQQYKIQRQRELQQLQHLAAHEQAQRRQQLEPEQRPSQEEILNRRRKRQEEEETRSRDFHKHILSQIFGVPFDDDGNETQRTGPTSTQKAAPPTELTSANEKIDATPAKAVEPPSAPKHIKPPHSTEDASESPTDAYADAHWSNAPERTRALAEIASLGRIFAALKNTFVFPEGRLERLAGSTAPRLAYNSTNTAIHAYEHALSELLSKLDTIESHGFKGVREARKQLVTSIEQELSALERKIAERLASGDVPAAPQEISVPIEDVSTHSEEPPKPGDAASVDVSATPQEVSAPIGDASTHSEEPSKRGDAPTQDVLKDEAHRDEVSRDPPTQNGVYSARYEAPRDEAPRDEAQRDTATQDVPSAVSEQVQDVSLEQNPTAAEMTGESATKVDAAVKAPEDQPLSDTQPIPETSLPDENPSAALDRNQDGGVAVTEHVPPATLAGDAPQDEDSEVEDAVEVMLEPQRTAVPAGEEHEYELV